MEFSDFSWFGSVYQTLEEFCTEVEETVDTFEVCLEACMDELIQDLRPSSWINTVTANNSVPVFSCTADRRTFKRLESVVEKKQSDMSSETTNLENEAGAESWNTELLDEAAALELTPSSDLSTQIKDFSEWAWASVDEGVISKETSDKDDCIARSSSDPLLLNMESEEVRSEGTTLVVPPNDFSSETDAVESTERESGAYVDVQNVTEEHVVADSGSSNNLNMIEADEFEDLGSEASRLFDSINIEESCVMVNKDECCSVLPLSGKRRSLKKKIRAAFFGSKSSKSKDSEQSGGDKRESLLANSKTSSFSGDSETHNSCESEWVLL